MKKRMILFIVCLVFLKVNCQTRNLGAKHPLQKSEIIREVPQESTGYLVLHKNDQVDYWLVNVVRETSDRRIVEETYRSDYKENFVKIDKEYFNDWSYSYEIKGKSSSGALIVDVYQTLAIGDPVWSYDDCNRPTCVKTSGGVSYAYALTLWQNVNNDSYKWQLQNAWQYVNEEGIRIPYYIEVGPNELTNALNYHGYVSTQGVVDQTSVHSYYWDNGIYKVALSRGPWQDDHAVTNQLNGIGNEGCTVSFSTAMNSLNTYLSSDSNLSQPLSCNGTQYSANQPGDMGNWGTFANASMAIVDCFFDVTITFMDFDIDWVDIVLFENVVQLPVITSVDITNHTVGCVEDTTPSSSSPCPPGYYYAPGGGDPCKPILEILEDITLHPIDVFEDNTDTDLEDERILKKGLYLAVLNYKNGMSIPIYKKINSDITIKESRSDIAKNMIVFPNPNKGKFTVNIPSKEAGTIEIKTIKGNTIYKEAFENITEKSITLKNYDKGLHFISIKLNSKEYTKKIYLE